MPKDRTSELRDMLLQAPIMETVVRLAVPNVLMMLFLSAVIVCDGIFIGALGSEALAAAALVFPVFNLMTNMAAAGLGGGVSSAVARSVGRGQPDEAACIVWHGAYLAIAMAAMFAGTFLVFGPQVFRTMGGRGEALTQAVRYSNILFGGAAAACIFQVLSSALRGLGHMTFPAVLSIGGGVVQLVLSATLMFGLAGMPAMGLIGAGVAMVVQMTVGSAVLVWYLMSGRAVVTPLPRHAGVRLALLKDILTVGVPACMNSLITATSFVVLTIVMALHGVSALAAYGIVSRLEHFLIFLVFGLGSALITLVGANLGAGQMRRGVRIAWTGVAAATVVTGGVGVLAALFPEIWMSLFSGDLQVLRVGEVYLRVVGVTYFFLGLGFSSYYASVGGGHAWAPMASNGMRTLIAGGGGWVVGHSLGGGATAVAGAIGAAYAVYGVTNAAIMTRTIGARQTSSAPTRAVGGNSVTDR